MKISMLKNNDFKGLIKEMNEFLEGKNPENLRVFKFVNGKYIEVINQLELFEEE